jgi:hypothetical protein
MISRKTSIHILWAALLSTALLLGTAGCEEEFADGGYGAWNNPNPSAPADEGPATLLEATRQDGGETTTPMPSRQPQGSEWVIVLQEFTGARRVQQAQALRTKLLGNDWKGVGVLHDGDRRTSMVFFGPFKHHDRKLEHQLAQVRGYQDMYGTSPFRGAYIYELPSTEARGGHKWSVYNCKGHWTLQIAHYVDPSPVYPSAQLIEYGPNWDRRLAAEEACSKLRVQGVEAYFYHGPKMSLVTVGSFPKEAFQYDPKRNQYKNYDPRTDTYLFEPIKELRKQEAFKYNLQNGQIVYKVFRRPGRTPRKVPWRSFLVKVPTPDYFK